MRIAPVLTVSNDRLRPPQEVAELVDGAIRRAHLAERLRCAEIIQLYPLDGFFYDDEHLTQEEILRFRDTISQAVAKNAPKGERIR